MLVRIYVRRTYRSIVDGMGKERGQNGLNSSGDLTRTRTRKDFWDFVAEGHKQLFGLLFCGYIIIRQTKGTSKTSTGFVKMWLLIDRFHSDVPLLLGCHLDSLQYLLFRNVFANWEKEA